jgi:hypothetical protein
MKKKYSKAMEILADRLFPKPVEEPIEVEGYEEAKGYDAKADIIMKAVTKGIISVGQGERLMNTLRNQVTIYESTTLIEKVEELSRKIKGNENEN